jgi:hypothetical protein
MALIRRILSFFSRIVRYIMVNIKIGRPAKQDVSDRLKKLEDQNKALIEQNNILIGMLSEYVGSLTYLPPPIPTPVEREDVVAIDDGDVFVNPMDETVEFEKHIDCLGIPSSSEIGAQGKIDKLKDILGRNK